MEFSGDKEVESEQESVDVSSTEDPDQSSDEKRGKVEEESARGVDNMWSMCSFWAVN